MTKTSHVEREGRQRRSRKRCTGLRNGTQSLLTLPGRATSVLGVGTVQRVSYPGANLYQGQCSAAPLFRSPGASPVVHGIRGVCGPCDEKKLQGPPLYNTYIRKWQRDKSEDGAMRPFCTCAGGGQNGNEQQFTAP